MYLPLRTVIYIKDKYKKSFEFHNYIEFKVDDLESVYLLDDSLAIAVKINLVRQPVPLNAFEIYKDKIGPYFDMPEQDKIYFCLNIEELTYNEINYKYNHSDFIRKIKKELQLSCYLGDSITYTKFRGYTRPYWCPNDEMPLEYYDKKIPELKLRERYETWEGIKYYFIVIEIKGADDSFAHVVSYTITNPHSYMHKFCDKIIKKKGYTLGEYVRGDRFKFREKLKSWKRIKYKERVENNLTYFVLEEYHKEKESVWKRADKIYQDKLEGKYINEERSTYSKPINRWKSEELMYNLICKIFKKYKVIYQYRPFFLKSSFGGQMSYDVYIPKLNIAFEYQGQQHFGPVDYFGGEESFKLTQARDREKQLLSKLHGIKVIYVNYWENLTESLIKSKINNVFSKN